LCYELEILERKNVWLTSKYECHPWFETHEKTKSEESVQGIIATGHYPEPTEYNP